MASPTSPSTPPSPPSTHQLPQRRRRTVAFFEPLPSTPRSPRQPQAQISNFAHRRTSSSTTINPQHRRFAPTAGHQLFRTLKPLVWTLTAVLLILLPTLAGFAVMKIVLRGACSIFPAATPGCGGYIHSGLARHTSPTTAKSTVLSGSFAALEPLTEMSPTLEFVGYAMFLASFNLTATLDILGPLAGSNATEGGPLGERRLKGLAMAANKASFGVDAWTGSDYVFRHEGFVRGGMEGVEGRGVGWLSGRLGEVVEGRRDGWKEKVLGRVVPYGGRWGVESRILGVYGEFLEVQVKAVEEMVVLTKGARLAVGKWREEVRGLERGLERYDERSYDGWFVRPREGCAFDAREEGRRVRGVGEAVRWMADVLARAEELYVGLLREVVRAREEIEMGKSRVRSLFGGSAVGEEALKELLNRERKQMDEVMKSDRAGMAIVEEIGNELMEAEDDGLAVKRKMEAAIAERRIEWW
ncbi:uncharacterized protein MYCGRDRAFT_91371 [Zymoseptoria tritici IPO323]|uniref:Uncharacterized protein n=1 Tax=Zymoseptoria tritici (strain CBS 115943 / IPO323) TaxID=336722 RepID=F9X620_ZYMTI|nr:uncharacterized protein MYCGRDRAFT_91371 [Zymoseptoria tritici IPO323]EGP89608.1 hypothetical protein MYCGRDRAFT_91371 [Zymoseptoria tritici IPO323]